MKNNTFKRYILIPVLAIAVVIVLEIIVQLFLSSSFFLNKTNTQKLQWTYVESSASQTFTSEEVEKSEFISLHNTKIFKDVKKRYFKFETTLGDFDSDKLLVIETLYNPVKVLANGNEIYNNGFPDEDFSSNKICEIHLPKKLSQSKVEIYICAKTALSLEGFVKNSKIKNIDLFQSATDISQMIANGNLRVNSFSDMDVSDIITLVLGIIFIIAGILSLFSYIATIFFKSNSKVTALLGVILMFQGILIILHSIPDLFESFSWFNLFKVHYAILLLSLICGTAAIYGLQSKWMLWQKIATGFMLVIIPVCIFKPFPQSEAVADAIALILPLFCFILLVCGIITLVRISDKYTSSFMFIAFAFLFALVVSSLCSGLNLFKAHYSIVLIFTVLLAVMNTYKKTKSVFTQEISLKARLENERQNTAWTDKIVSQSARVTTVQRLEDFCVNMCECLKTIIYYDHENGIQKAYALMDGLTACAAVKENGLFRIIHADNKNRNDYNFESIEKRVNSTFCKGVLWGSSCLDVALYHDGGVAVICHIEGLKTGFSVGLKNAVKTIYPNLTVAFDNLKLKDKIYQTQDEIFYNLAEITEGKSPSTGGHLRRVAAYVKEICLAYGMSEEESGLVSRASMLHDLGKVVIPQDINEKKTTLTPSEFNIMKMHVVWGYNIFSGASGELMKTAAIIAQQHHERWDGSGYIKLAGEQIHKYARIVAVADVFDALTSLRSYKETWSLDEARMLINKFSGEHFEEKAVIAFNNCFYKLVSIYNGFKQ